MPGREHLLRFLQEAGEALEAARTIVEERSLEEFLASMESRYALRYALVLLVESLVDMIVSILEEDYGLAPESYREAFLLAGEKGLLPYRVAERLARLASLRNMLIHRYWRVDDARLYRETRIGLASAREALERLKRIAEASDP